MIYVSISTGPPVFKTARARTNIGARARACTTRRPRSRRRNKRSDFDVTAAL